MSRKSFTGSYCLLVILLCIGIIPGIVYYLVARREIGGTQQTIQQNVIIQQPSAQQTPIQQKYNQQTPKLMYCPQCGEEVKSNFCEKCGTKIK